MNLEPYVHEVVRRLTTGRRGTGSVAHLFVVLLRELAKGEPVAPAVLAPMLDQPVGCVTAALEDMVCMEWDDRGNVMGYVLTLRETAHAFEVGGHRLYTWCAFDALFIPALIERTAHVVSTCAATRERVSLTVTPSQIETMQPADVAVSLIWPQQDTPNIRDAFCRHVRFFASMAEARHWADAPAATSFAPARAVFAAGHVCAQELLQACRSDHDTNAIRA